MLIETQDINLVGGDICARYVWKGRKRIGLIVMLCEKLD